MSVHTASHWCYRKQCTSSSLTTIAVDIQQSSRTFIIIIIIIIHSFFGKSVSFVHVIWLCLYSTITSVNEAYCDQTLANGEHIQRTLLIASNLYLCLVFIIILIAGKPLCIPSHISSCTLWLLFILRVLSIWLECMAFVNCSQSQQTVWI